MNTFTKTAVVAVIAFCAAGAFAAPHHKQPQHHEHNNGIRLATDIVNLVNSSIRLLTGTPAVVVNQTPVAVTTPAVIIQETVPAQTVIVNNPPPPPPRTVVINNRPPKPHNTVIINNPPPYRPKPQPVKHHYGRPTIKNVKHNFAAQPRRR